MTSTLTSSCPLTGSTSGEPDCSKRLLLRECQQRWRLDAQHGVVDTGRHRCRYAVWGQGPTLVLIPGMSGDALSFVMLMARLQTHFRCVSFDLPDGTGDGAHRLPNRHADFTSELFTLLDHLRIRTGSLLGVSFGSTVALAALHQQPARFTHAILQAGFARSPLSAAEAFLASWARFLPGRLGHIPFIQRLLAENHREPFLARESDVWDYFVEGQCRVPLRALASRALMAHRLDLRPLLPAIRQPVLLVNGDHEPAAGRIREHELKQGLPLAARAEIEQCGQHPHLTHPEVFAEVVRQFLLPTPCGGTR